MVLWHTRQYVHEELRGTDQMASRILSNSRLHLGSVLKNGPDADRIIWEKNTAGEIIIFTMMILLVGNEVKQR